MNELSKREMRTVFCETLMNMAENDQKVIVLDADLSWRWEQFHSEKNIRRERLTVEFRKQI